jgi:23S rRNA (adenine2503-C2)-methyltransferase
MMREMNPEIYPVAADGASRSAGPPTPPPDAVTDEPPPAAAAAHDRAHVLDPAAGLGEWLVGQGQPAWRAKAIRRWLCAGRAATFADMTDLPKPLRMALEERFRIFSTRIARHVHAEDGTEKLLLELADGQRIECVLLREHGRERPDGGGGSRLTVCISSQVGCGMGCVFCASGLDGVIRNLTTGEILEQLLRLQLLLPADDRISHIVVMGMGEPLANLDRLLPALATAQDPDGLGISQRRITISTVGLPKAIDRLTAENPGYHLAVSLHAADDALRTRLVPVNKAIGLAEVMAAADRYWEASGRRLTFEYVLLGGVNDTADDAARLARLLGRRAALVNVIPYNTVAGLPWREPAKAAQARFLDVLRAAGVNVQVRRRKGARIDAACGQLRRLEAGAGAAAPDATPAG